jgi:hypothetical protein
VALVAGVVAVAAVLAASARPGDRPWPIPAPEIELGAGIVATVVAVLAFAELLFDLDQLDGSGGPIGAALVLALAIAAIALVVGALGGRNPGALLAAAVGRSDRGTKIALGGLGLDLVVMALGLTVSVYALGTSATFAVTFMVLAVLVLVGSAGWRLPFPAPWLAVGLAVVTVVFAFDQLGQYRSITARFELDMIDNAVFMLHLLAIVLVLAGAILSALDHQRLAVEDAATGTAPGEPPIVPPPPGVGG